MARMSIKDIARLAGTSSATVSRVLSGRTYVRPAVADRVREVVKKQGFIMNSSASALARRRSPRHGIVHRTIALVFCGLKQSHLADVNTLLRPDLQAGIQEAAAELDLAVSTWFINQEQMTQGRFPSLLSRRQLDGILLKPMQGENADIFGEIAPCLLIGARPEPQCKFPVVEVDNDAGISALMRHLHGLGHRRFEFLTRQLPHVPFHEREISFREHVQLFKGEGRVYSAETDNFDEYARQFKSRPAASRPTALVCASDFRAVQLIHDLHQHGVRVPDDVSVTGFDGAGVGAAVFPPLTTWAPHWQQVGRASVKILLEMIAGKEVPTRTLVGGELVIRKSTAPPAGGA